MSSDAILTATRMISNGSELPKDLVFEAAAVLDGLRSECWEQLKGVFGPEALPAAVKWVLSPMNLGSSETRLGHSEYGDEATEDVVEAARAYVATRTYG